MKTYLQMNGDQLVEYVEKRELGDLISLLASEKSTRNHLIERGAELERELEATKTKLKEAYYDLLNIATMLEYDQDDCHRLRNLGRKAASNIQPFLKP